MHPDFATFIDAQKKRFGIQGDHKSIAIPKEDIVRTWGGWQSSTIKPAEHCKFKNRVPFNVFSLKFVKWLENFKVLEIHFKNILFI